ncbi:hypothetical protein R0135_06015 [Congregibacter variabilis]|uniref:Lipopolysaccharide assembly protein A domain-containing protein n=1 Tax=Congregibacter variabilis TaxID=3081200 RepID=A0ABZ0I6D7_9GAMM|nr:hypothetical protein R0135_06015 [Congregibacter sp. IMCC43200]
MTFTRFLKTQILMAVLSGLALGIVLCIALLLIGGVNGEIALDIELASADGFWGLLLLPLLLAVLVLLVSPLSYTLILLVNKWRNRRASAD